MLRRLRAVIACGICTLALIGTDAAAARPSQGSGTFVEPSSNTVSVRQAGPLTFIVLENVVNWAGPINGVAQETLHLIVFPSGEAVFHGVDVVAENDGSTLRLALVGRDNAGAFQGTFVITGGSSTLRGHGTFSGFDSCGNRGVCGTYSGTFFSKGERGQWESRESH
jgi:hypothetical protein